MDETGVDYESGWFAARTLHCDLGSGYCEECSRFRHHAVGDPMVYRVKWPCRTILALEGELGGTGRHPG